MRSCPTCGSPRIHRSRVRGLLERVRRLLVTDRPHRCDACGWRGWGPETSKPGKAYEPAGRRRPVPDIDAIDRAITVASNGSPTRPSSHPH